MENREKYDDDDDVGSGSDRISQLPDSVLLRILCFLSHKKAVQTSVLSKSWRHLGPTRPVIDLRQTCTSSTNRHVGVDGVCQICFKGNKEEFLSVLENTFQRYHDFNIFPHELRLQMILLELDSQSISSVLEKWIRIFINPDNPVVASLNLSFDYSSFLRRQYFNLPSVVFKAHSLQNLCLHGCILADEIDSMDNLLLKNLKILSFSNVLISDEALEKVISGCPLAERLVLDRCKGFKTIIINGNKNRCLNYFDISYCYGTYIEIDAPTLESIHIFCGSPNWYPNNSNNNYFPHLKSLSLSNATLSKELFHDFSCNFPRLQELTLFYCRGFQELNISSRSIKRLTIHGARSSLKKFAIEVPNILYVMLSSVFLQTTLSLTTTSSREWKSHLNLYQCENGYENDVLLTILKLFGMVKAVSQSQISLTLLETLNFKMNQIEWDFNDCPVVVQHLDLNIRNRLCLNSLGHFLNVLLRIFRPRYMEVKSGNSDKEAAEILWKALIHEREKKENGWEQHLEEVSMEASDKKGEKWHHVKYLTCLPGWTKDQKIRFRFKWRDGLAS